jgi:hypothetical protein
MKRRSSYCLRVSIASIPPGWRRLALSLQVWQAGVPSSHFQTQALETNHERTLYVRYVFRNHLISGERGADWLKAT